MENRSETVLIEEYLDGIKLQMLILFDWLRGKKENCPCCGARIIWCEDIDGDDFPVDFEGNNHFYSCSKRDRAVN